MHLAKFGIELIVNADIQQGILKTHPSKVLPLNLDQTQFDQINKFFEVRSSVLS